MTPSPREPEPIRHVPDGDHDSIRGSGYLGDGVLIEPPAAPTGPAPGAQTADEGSTPPSPAPDSE